MKAAIYELVLHEAGIFIGKGKKNVRHFPNPYSVSSNSEDAQKTAERDHRAETKSSENQLHHKALLASELEDLSQIVHRSARSRENTTLRGLRKGIR
jgi:hypothetical protein